MPIFQDDLGGAHDSPPSKPATRRSTSPVIEKSLARKLSEDSIRTDLCEGPLVESLEEESDMPSRDVESRPRTSGQGTSDRGAFIELLKRGESPTWLPNRNLESLFHDYDETPRKPSSNGSHSSPLLPAAEIAENPRSVGNEEDRYQAGLHIERPRSALHSGDFTEARETSGGSLLPTSSNLYRDGQNAWIATSPPRNFTPYQLDPRFPPAEGLNSINRARSRAPSLSSSYSSSFILKPPTSPLVQSESNEELDLSSQVDPISITSGYTRNPRRHTLNASHSIHSTPPGLPSSPFNRPLPHLRRDNTYPYQAHQPRRSLTSNPMPLPTSSPQTPAFLHSRRPSWQSDSSPLHHASMVGSYEESILRGRMSTTPSKPLDFVAQIGVLGLGKCKASLRCPAHVTLPFPAVFYSYESTAHGRTGKSEDGPSPYVGQIDLENGLPNPDEARENKKKRLSANLGSLARTQTEDLDMVDGPSTIQLSEREIRRAEKQKRRSTSPRAPPGGSYRIPEKGQVQIVIKNPNKTAVKLFLVPYDLTGMEPGTKTFIRQRSYSTGPIIDSALSSTQQIPTSSPLDRPTLRYLVHLHICSPSRGRFYLYKSIRVVFANRVPDGKEKLRNEISLPEPRFSVYKPGRDSSLGLALNTGAGASLAAEKAFRRRSSGFALGHSARNFDSMDGTTQALEKGFGGSSSTAHVRDFSTNTPVQPIPFSLYRKPVRSEDEDVQSASVQEPSLASDRSGNLHQSQNSGSSMSWDSNSTGIGAYDKLSKGDPGYGGNAFASSPDGRQLAEGLLAKKLRDLGVGMQSLQDQSDGI
ncbi:uncharacterized protein PAC_12320 [Phialocephala subalpina]|uniref:Atos-like conserved domain-containing protein n=1 Tax=Phialocephala subalpina TaxID=576137 RepID=A0A1L7XBM4_9HELO|nr:uncharacterized protein PAC_12320 [Phialocephala subalpina]